MTSQITSFVALGDSFTEGLDDARDDQQGFRGWADRLAEHLAADQPGLRYANLAVRGKLLRHVVEEQLPQAIAMSPDLVSIAAGGNDMLHLRIDPDELGRAFDEAVRTLLMAGCRVLMFTGFDPRFPFPVLRLIRGKISIYNMHLRAIAERHHCDTVDLWSMRVLRDKRAWSADRLHLTPDAHRRVALRAAEVLGVPVAEDWRAPWPDDGLVLSGTRAWLAARNTDLRWAREHAAPWVGRQLRGVSTADGKHPKRPELAPLRFTGHGLR